jgi:hypothetical protein
MTTEAQTAAVANGIITLVAQCNGLKAQIDALATQWTNLGAANLLNAFNTAAITSTGGIGTVDGTPNVAHIINTSVAPGSLLTRSISANNIASMLTYLQGVSSAIGGNAVSANGAAASLIALTL